MNFNTQYTDEQIHEWKSKSEKWDSLAEKISKFYCDKDGEYSEDNAEDGGDLLDIGEVTAMAFGWF